VTLAPSVQDIQTYLLDSGWQQQPRTWREATIWSYGDGYEVLVPPRDNLADAGLRLQEILTVLAQVEQRSAIEIADDISSPFDDIQLYRSVPEGLPDGYIPLDAGFRSLHGIRTMVSAAARSVIENAPQAGGSSQTVSKILQHIRLGPTRAGSYVFTLRLPVSGTASDTNGRPGQAGDEVPPLGRQVAWRLYEAIVSVHGAASAATENDLTTFESTTAAGVSPGLCNALSQLAGRQYNQPFDITFRWARGLPADTPPVTVRFAAGIGRVIRAGGMHLREQGAFGDVAMTGVIEDLHDEAESTNRWLIRIRGTVIGASAGEAEQTLWIRLDSQESYDQAISAHQAQRRVHVSGEMITRQGRTVLFVSGEGFNVLD
jgi:hypothetical protein